jgi:hypothetical protein
MIPKKFYLLAVLLTLLGLAVGFVWARSSMRPTKPQPAAPIARPTPPGPPEGIFCTQEAKLCPDGSYVSRTGPKCEFTPCPQASPLPIGYTLDSYDIAKITGEACQQASDCVTPIEYQLRSSCPYTSLCLQNKCAVVCPKSLQR